MSTRARILTTIGAAWVLAVLVASVALSSATKREHYDPDGNGPILSVWRDAYPWSTWWAIVGIITAGAVAGAIVATTWTRHD